jgi:hypothetical protein
MNLQPTPGFSIKISKMAEKPTDIMLITVVMLFIQ